MKYAKLFITKYDEYFRTSKQAKCAQRQTVFLARTVLKLFIQCACLICQSFIHSFFFFCCHRVNIIQFKVCLHIFNEKSEIKFWYLFNWIIWSKKLNDDRDIYVNEHENFWSHIHTHKSKLTSGCVVGVYTPFDLCWRRCPRALSFIFHFVYIYKHTIL